MISHEFYRYVKPRSLTCKFTLQNYAIRWARPDDTHAHFLCRLKLSDYPEYVFTYALFLFSDRQTSIEYTEQ